MKKICLAWIDTHDLNHIARNTRAAGPIIALLQSPHGRDFDELHLLDNKSQPLCEYSADYAALLRAKHLGDGVKLAVHEFDINPSDFDQIYRSVSSLVEKLKKAAGREEIKFFFHMSPGTSQMSAMWMLLAKTVYPAELYQSFHDRKNNVSSVKIVNLPFDLDFEYKPGLKKKADREVSEYIGGATEYEMIIHQSEIMRDMLRRAHKISLHDVPVLILGETGTGKELLANAIHADSERAARPLVTLNCSAIHEETANATLFGWSKGAWTGSAGEGKGLFLENNGGTIFLDEIGDLDIVTQTKLLRVIQQGEVQRVGDGKVFKTDVRLICATHKDLMGLVTEGRFREDLYYRISVFILDLPPLRSRGKDIILIAEKMLERVNETSAKNKRLKGYEPRKLSLDAKNLIMRHRWPGNVRELYNTLQRICVWGDDVLITADELKQYITGAGTISGPAAFPENAAVLLPDCSAPIDLDAVTDELRKKYILRALEISGGNRTEASKLLGYRNYQTLTNEMKKLNII
jgi:DNA-binding NtrC family response regulator